MSKLTIVEGLTGSGKSTLAHFLARQYRHAGMKADWLHEGFEPHPLLIPFEDDVEEFKEITLQCWDVMVRDIMSSKRNLVVEAAYFNNCLENLFIHNVDLNEILDFSTRIETIIKPLDPALIYLHQSNIVEALKVNFENRGPGFQKFVMDYCLKTQIARSRGWQGYDGMMNFWEEFVNLTDQAFGNLSINKLKVDNTKRDWEKQEKEILNFLGLSYHSEKEISQGEAEKLIGKYSYEKGGEREVDFEVYLQDNELMVNFLHYRTHLIKNDKNKFEAAGWYFEFIFESSKSGLIEKLLVRGGDVEYLHLTGIEALKE